MTPLALLTLFACGTSTVDSADSGNTTDTDTDTDTPLPDPSGLLDDPDAEGCNRIHHDPPDVLSLEDRDAGVRLGLRSDFGGIGQTSFEPVTLTFDGTDGTSMVLDYPPGLDWEVGCGSIEEAAALPHPESLVFWSAQGQATLELSPDAEDDWMWHGTLTLDDVAFVDESGEAVFTIDHHEVAAVYSASPPA